MPFLPQTTNPTQSRMASLLARLQSASVNPFATTTGTNDTPTVTTSSTATITDQIISPAVTTQVTQVGNRSTWSNSRLPMTNKSGLDLFLTGTTIEYEVFPAVTGATAYWIFVNNVPVTSAPQTISTTSSTTVFVKLTFPTTDRRRIEFFFLANGSWFSVRTTYSQLITAAPRRPVFGFVGDSFYGGSAACGQLQCSDFIMSRYLGVENVCSGLGGTGWNTTNGSFPIFGDSARVAAIAAANPEVIVFQGSLNDDGKSGIQAACASALAAYQAACPNASFIILGPQPNAATATISANRATNINAVYNAASTNSAVIGFHDQVGTVSGSVPAAAATFQTYPDGTLRTYLGSVWKVNNGGSSWSNGPYLPPKYNLWQQVTAAYFGTGNTGTPTGDGTRDTYLYSDGTHPTVDGSAALATAHTRWVRDDIKAAAGL